MTANKLDYIYNYVMDDIEYSEAAAVEHAINSIMKRNILRIGTPDITSDYTQGFVAGCIKVIEIDYEYHYYLLTIGEKGTRDYIYINEKVSHYGEIRRDYVVLYLLIYLGLKNVRAYHIHEGYLVRAVCCKNSKIKLKQVLSYGVSSLNNDAQHAIGNEKPIFDRYKCECGHSVFYIHGETVGMDCPICSTHIMF